jgi:hypothetical protein
METGIRSSRELGKMDIVLYRLIKAVCAREP